MKVNAIAVANYFVHVATEREKCDLRLIGLIKRVYMTHGFSLAMLNRGILDPRFDVVEAWKFGPVIPSVYHSFKHNENNPIRKKSSVISEVDKEKIVYDIPILVDNEIIEIADAVWTRYKSYTDSQLISMLNREGTPWGLCYIAGQNIRIPDLYTQVYYEKLLQSGRK